MIANNYLIYGGLLPCTRKCSLSVQGKRATQRAFAMTFKNWSLTKAGLFVIIIFPGEADQQPQVRAMGHSKKRNAKSVLRVGAWIILFSGLTLLIGIPLQQGLSEGTIAIRRSVAYKIVPEKTDVVSVSVAQGTKELTENPSEQIDWIMDDEVVQLACYSTQYNCLTPMIKEVSRSYHIDTITYNSDGDGKWSRAVLLTVRPR